MRRFELCRDSVVVAQGVEFGDRRVFVRWGTRTRRVFLWESMDAVLSVHGHGGDTRVVWVDPG
jgi:hypothetical protein